VEVERAAGEHVQLLHPEPDPEDRRPPLEDLRQQVTVEVFAPRGHRVHRRRHRLAVPPRVHVGPAGQNHPAHHVEDGVDLGVVVLADGREDDRQRPGGDDRVEVRGVQLQVRGAVLGGEEFGVDADEGAGGGRGRVLARGHVLRPSVGSPLPGVVPRSGCAGLRGRGV
jgi:hypothetical protein